MIFRYLLEKHGLASVILTVVNDHLGGRRLSLSESTIVDATIIDAPSKTKNRDGKRNPEMHQRKNGNRFYCTLICADAESGLVHSVVDTAANVADVAKGDQLLHGE